MRNIVLIIFMLLSLSLFSQDKSKPNYGFEYPRGNKIIVYPDGAYVPNWWINKAVDSTGVWREGTTKFYIAVQRISSYQQEINILEDEYTAYKKSCSSSIDEANRKIFSTKQKNAELSDKISKLKPWATIGKISTITISAGIVVGAIIIVQNELK
jgi:hypothetical protein